MKSKKWGDVLQSLPRQWLYLILLIASTVPLFLKVLIPNTPDPSSTAMYSELMSIPTGSTVLLSSDWTNSTRGESKSEFDAILKILMRRKIKAVLYSIADPQAPQVASDEITELNRARKAANLPEYQEWTEWVNAGYFSNGDGTAEAMLESVHKAFNGKKDMNQQGQMTDIFQSPVLKGINKLNQIAALIDITASNTTVTYVQKLNHAVKLLFAVTGVMGPEALPYFTSNQSKGLVIGIKGAYDMETLMEYGVNEPGPNEVASSSYGKIPGFPGMNNFAQGSEYYPALNAALAVMILAVVVGNIGMFLAKGGRK